MMYPFLTLDDSAEIVHSEMRPDGTVKVYVEKPDETDCFHSAFCILPGYQWQDVSGFSPDELTRYEEVIRSTAHLILQFSQEGGFDSAAGF
ncbi:MAG: hypothetical protein IKT52_00340 [Oscillospiraceae bacterium]|nr:hypothetical protein [Oscillospiraceae bacterium]